MCKINVQRKLFKKIRLNQCEHLQIGLINIIYFGVLMLNSQFCVCVGQLYQKTVGFFNICIIRKSCDSPAANAAVCREPRGDAEHDVKPGRLLPTAQHSGGWVGGARRGNKGAV